MSDDAKDDFHVSLHGAPCTFRYWRDHYNTLHFFSIPIEVDISNIRSAAEGTERVRAVISQTVDIPPGSFGFQQWSNEDAHAYATGVAQLRAGS